MSKRVLANERMERRPREKKRRKADEAKQSGASNTNAKLPTPSLTPPTESLPSGDSNAKHGNNERGFEPTRDRKRKSQMEQVDESTKKQARLGNRTTPMHIKTEPTACSQKRGKAKKEDLQEDEWKWWEEKKPEDGRKWTTLCHSGPLFAPDYIPIPANVSFKYDGRRVKLTTPAEEVMTFYAKLLNTKHASDEVFNSNYFRDWRTYMTAEEQSQIVDFDKCDFSQVHEHILKEAELRKNRTKEEKKKDEIASQEIRQRYGFCLWDGHRQPIQNFKIEPPGIFQGRGDHPKRGSIKRRIMPEDVTINCDLKLKAPEPPENHYWKDVKHDNKVSWLATWNENVTGNNKYVMLNASSRVKAERDFEKYQKARRLHVHIDRIRQQYQSEWKSREMRIRQRAVAIYFIDRLALRVGNEKEEDEADTVGCCSLRYEHVKLHPHLEPYGDNVIELNFLGKDSIRYHNFVSVQNRVYRNVELFLRDKCEGDDLFDRVTTSSLNQYLTELLDGLTAKVFRTYNASRTLQDQLDILTKDTDSVHEKWLAYNKANREVAILCNHQRAVPKTFDKSMQSMKEKMSQKEENVRKREEAFVLARDAYNADLAVGRSTKTSEKKLQSAKIQLDKANEMLEKVRVQAEEKEANKQIALGTSKLNYLDPRISVAWCKKFNVPIEKIFSKAQRDKFKWAIHMADEHFHFYNFDESELQQQQQQQQRENGGDAESCSGGCDEDEGSADDYS
ncbi:hypothetical protein ACOME3_010113 [Neoechinorhynchus agilis]